jgi:hypothetical protein
MPRPLTPEEIAWQQAQPLIGTPSLTRLRAALKEAGLPALRIVLGAERESVQFWIYRGQEVRRLDEEQTTRRLITIFRASGFEVGFTELGITDFHATRLFGSSLVGPLDQLCEQGPPPAEP